jgi:hypothetical protein
LQRVDPDQASRRLVSARSAPLEAGAVVALRETKNPFRTSVPSQDI